MFYLLFKGIMFNSFIDVMFQVVFVNNGNFVNKFAGFGKPTIFKTCCEKLWLMKVASRARFLGELILPVSSCGGSVAVSLTVNRSNSESSRLSKKSFLPTLCTMISQEYTDLVQHISVARIASVAKTLPSDLASCNIQRLSLIS